MGLRGPYSPGPEMLDSTESDTTQELGSLAHTKETKSDVTGKESLIRDRHCN